MGQQTEAATTQQAMGPLAFLDSLHVTDADGAVTNRKWPEAQAAHADVAALVAVAKRALPFLQDEADKYDDDGSNEPLETLRELRAALAPFSEAQS